MPLSKSAKAAQQRVVQEIINESPRLKRYQQQQKERVNKLLLKREQIDADIERARTLLAGDKT